MKRLLLITSFLAMLTALGGEELAIRTIDMQYIFDNYYKTMRFEKAIVGDADMVYLDGLEKERAELREQLNRLRAKTQSLAMTDEAKEESKEQGMRVLMQLQERDKDVDRMRRKIASRKTDERDAILSEITSVVVKYSKENSIDLLFDISGRTLNGIPTIIYSKPTIDISKTMLALLNAGHEKEIEEMQNAKSSDMKPAAEATDTTTAPDDKARDAARKAVQDAAKEGAGN